MCFSSHVVWYLQWVLYHRRVTKATMELISSFCMLHFYCCGCKWLVSTVKKRNSSVFMHSGYLNHPATTDYEPKLKVCMVSTDKLCPLGKKQQQGGAPSQKKTFLKVFQVCSTFKLSQYHAMALRDLEITKCSYAILGFQNHSV